MANKTSQYPKKQYAVFVEPRFKELCKIVTKEMGCFHKETGDFSEFMRRAAKREMARIKPYLKNTEKSIDWDEAY
ncbi:MAG: hypothetical protein IMZ61_02095 [Planctomycetes bacterium]|nr:hypothetical protein [Thermoplasmata archaeon]MBE3142700.1 hypothetical protein [Planctomycetota bacterium]